MLLLLFIGSHIMIAQTGGSVKGTIKDERGNAMPGVFITLEGTTLKTFSSETGSYLIKNIPAGKYIIKVSLESFETHTKNIVIADGKIVNMSFVLKDALFKKYTIQVTSTRRTTDVQTTAAAVSAVSGKKLEDQGIVDVTDFIDAVPGVTSVSNGTINRVIIRNLATSTQEAGSPMTATYFDDFPISVVYGGIPAIRMLDLDRVEVLKGPQGTLFGRSAMSGVVRYIPNKPNTEKFEGNISTYTSSTTDGGMNFGGHAYLNVPINKNMAIRLLGYSFNDSGFIDNIELDTPDFNDEKTWGGRLAFHWTATEKLSIDLLYLKESTKGSYAAVTTTRDPGDLNIVGDEGPDVPFDIKARTMVAGTNPEQSTEYDFFNLKLKYDFGSFAATLLATHAINKVNWVSDQREYVGVISGTIPDIKFDNRPSGTDMVNVLELRIVSESGKFIDWIAGLYYDDSKYDGFHYSLYYGPDQLMLGFLPLTNAMVMFDSEFETTAGEMAAYGELGFNFSKKTRFVLGYRHSNINTSTVSTKADGLFEMLLGEQAYVNKLYETDENANTYKIAIEHTFSKDMFAYALASSGYRRGGYNRPTMVSEFSTFNSDNLWNYEFGLKTTWFDGHLLANVAAFMLKYDDIQLVVQDPVTFVLETKNVGEAQIMGIEFALNYFVNKYLQFNFNGSISNPELLKDIPPEYDYFGNPIYTGRKGDKLPGSATESFSFSADFNYPVNNNINMFASASYRYVGDRLNDFNEDLVTGIKLPSYSLVDLRLGMNLSNGLTFSLFVNNLMDEAIIFNIDYQGQFFQSVPTNRPRTIGLNLSYNFD